MLNKSIKFLIENKLVAVLLLALFVGWGIVNAPFNWDIPFLPNDPVAVDAIPDIGENQQIVFTNWQGRSPQNIEDQITYPLTTSLLGIPGVKTIRSSSMFGFSSIYVIFEEDVEFYWSRSRILEKLNSLPAGLLPEGVNPTLGPDATGLGQIFWYTLEGRDKDGNVTGGWDLHELRSIQDYYIKYALASASGVSEVASIGGYVQEYQVDVNPELLKYDKLYQSVEQAEVLNQKESAPMLGFGVEYVNQENSPMITSPYKDMVMPMVSLSIPIFNNKYKSQTRQNELRKQEIQFQKEERLNVLKADLSKAISQQNQARIKFSIQKQNLKQAEDAEEILIKNYETGIIDFKDILDIQELQLKFQTAQIESVTMYYVQSAIINYLSN